MKNFLILGATLLAGATTTTVVQAGQSSTPQSSAGAAARVDPVSRVMFISTMDAEFKKMDADKNGVLTAKEIQDFQRVTSVAMAQQRNVALFQALDKDKNGQLSPAEFRGLPMNVAQPNAAPVLAQVDGNRDGKVTLVEYRAGKLVNFDKMDADKDGIVTPSEMRAAGLIK